MEDDITVALRDLEPGDLFKTTYQFPPGSGQYRADELHRLERTANNDYYFCTNFLEERVKLMHGSERVIFVD